MVHVDVKHVLDLVDAHVHELAVVHDASVQDEDGYFTADLALVRVLRQTLALLDDAVVFGIQLRQVTAILLLDQADLVYNAAVVHLVVVVAEVCLDDLKLYERIDVAELLAHLLELALAASNYAYVKALARDLPRILGADAVARTRYDRPVAVLLARH